MTTTESLYRSTLEAAVRSWIQDHREEYTTIREGVVAQFHRPGQPLPAKGTLTRQSIDAAVVETIRKRIGFPSERSHEAGERLPIAAEASR